MKYFKTMDKFKKAYLYTRTSRLTKSNVWVLSTKKQNVIKFGSIELSGASSNTYRPGDTNDSAISTVWLNIEEGSEQESIIHDMVEQNGGSTTFTLQIDKESGATKSILTHEEYDNLMEKEDVEEDSTQESASF